jgi:hypothetical protein
VEFAMEENSYRKYVKVMESDKWKMKFF